MTDQTGEQSYKWQRRYVFTVTLAVLIMLPVLFWLLA
jgi:hypothetical protein